MVLIFMNFGGGGGQGMRWWVGPLLTLLPLLLSSGLLTAPLRLLSLLFGFGATRTFVYDPDTQLWRPQGAGGPVGSGGATSAAAAGAAGAGAGAGAASQQQLEEEEVEDIGFLWSMISMFATAALTVLIMKCVVAWRTGVRPRSWRQLLSQGAGAGGAGGGRRQGQQGRQAMGRTQSQRIEHVAKLIQALPVEVHRSKEELERLPVAELKDLLQKRGGECRECLEKSELVEALLASENSSASTCIVCCEDYQPGDVLRVLPCSHRFHVECVDRWCFTSTDYSRPTSCPLCNTELPG